MEKSARSVPYALRVLPVFLVLPALFALGSALTSGFAADAARPAAKTPLQVTYYYLPG